jgi:hypothetical protein
MNFKLLEFDFLAKRVWVLADDWRCYNEWQLVH